MLHVICQTISHKDYNGMRLCANCIYLNKIQVPQNRTARIICNNFDWNVSASALVKSLGWFSLSEQEARGPCMALHGILPDETNILAALWISAIYIYRVHTQKVKYFSRTYPGVFQNKFYVYQYKCYVCITHTRSRNKNFNCSVCT